MIGIVNSIQVGGSGEIIPSAGGLIQSVNILPNNNKIHTQGPTSGGTLMCQSVNLVAENQVWSLTHFILVSFLCKKKSLIFLEGKSMTPRRGYYSLFCSSQQLTCLRLRPFSSSPRGLLLELQRYKDTVRCIPLGAEFSGHL